MDFMLDMANKHMGFNRKLEMVEITNVENTNEYQTGYEVGLGDLIHAMKVYYPLNSEERLNYFGINISTENFAVNNPKDLIAKAKAYEEKKMAEEESIKVGDEVKTEGGYKAIVSYIFDRKQADVLFYDGSTGKREIEHLSKTGRNFNNEVEQLLDKMRGKK